MDIISKLSQGDQLLFHNAHITEYTVQDIGKGVYCITFDLNNRTYKISSDDPSWWSALRTRVTRIYQGFLFVPSMTSVGYGSSGECILVAESDDYYECIEVLEHALNQSPFIPVWGTGRGNKGGFMRHIGQSPGTAPHMQMHADSRWPEHVSYTE
jgi:hypothetical protein